LSAVKRSVSAVALFALVLQLCASFAHIHHEDFHGIAGHGALTWSAPGQDDTDADRDHCAVCVAGQIAASGFWGNVSVPDAPAASISIAPLACDRGAGCRVTTAFQARGPPADV